MTELSAFAVVQVAAAVFCGNLLTLWLIKGFKSIDETPGSTRLRGFAGALVPLLFILAALIGSTN